MHFHVRRLLRLLAGQVGIEIVDAGGAPVSLSLEVGTPQGSKVRTEHMNLTLKDDASQAFKVELQDKFGDAAVATGPLTVTSSDESIVKASLSTDGATLMIVGAGTGKLGSALVSVTSEADHLAAQVEVTVVGGAAAQIVLTPIEPQLTPAVAAPEVADAVAAPSSSEPVTAVPPPEAAPAA